MFDMRIREEAEGERRMIGSGLECVLRELLIERPADGAGTKGLLPGLVGWPGRLRLRSRKISALLRT